MPEIEIRPFHQADLPDLMTIQLDYLSSRVWQFNRAAGDGDVGGVFREARLPREARIEYPRTVREIFSGHGQDVYLAALLDGAAVGYLRLSDQVAPRTVWAKDLAVRADLRRRGIGAALLLAGLDWTAEGGFHRMVVEMQSKNAPAVALVRKLGFEFCGYHDQFYSNQDIALFFTRPVK